jgi:hypothetical protein
MSLSAAILFDRALKQTRKAALREQGLVPRPLPQIRVVRWLRAPRETYAAWSLMLLENVRSLDEAVDEVREERRARMRRREDERPQLRALGSGRRMPQLPRSSGSSRDEVSSGEPAIVTEDGSRPPERVFDLTAEDDTVSMPTVPRANAWDSLEQKLKDLEKLYG